MNLISANNNTIRGNLIGTDVTGTAAVPNSGDGAAVIVQLGSTGNLIGGFTAADRNVISGNAFSGVWLLGGGTNGNTVAGNYIGTDSRGTGLITGTVAWYKGEGSGSDVLGAHNGTLVNGRPLQRPQQLSASDSIRIGDTEYRYQE